RELGAEVTIADDLGVLEDPGVDVVVLLTDTLGEEQRRAVEAWVADGGRLVVTDPGSELAPPATAEFRDVADLGRRAADCDIAALDGIAVEDVEPRSGGVLFDPPADADACIRDGLGDAYVVARDRGEGTVVAVGGSGMVVNDGLAEGENAPVVAALVAPEPSWGSPWAACSTAAGRPTGRARCCATTCGASSSSTSVCPRRRRRRSSRRWLPTGPVSTTRPCCGRCRPARCRPRRRW